MTGNIRTKKAHLRSSILKKRRSMSDSECQRLSRIICERFLESEEYRTAGSILLYKAYNNEVDTDLIFEQAISDGKTVAYPLSRIVDGEPDLTFHVIESQDQLSAGYKGIPEPSGVCQPFEKRADVCITPGAVFDRKCHRIGYGKAFYDRYLRLNSPGVVIGLAYELQIADDFEPEESDRSMDMVITEINTFR